jgi:hypothetical protein
MSSRPGRSSNRHVSFFKSIITGLLPALAAAVWWAIRTAVGWVLVGAAVGIAGPVVSTFYIGPAVRKFSGKPALTGGNDPGVAASFLPLMTVPACALLSGGAASICLIKGLTFNRRIFVCSCVNGMSLTALTLFCTMAYLWWLLNFDSRLLFYSSLSLHCEPVGIYK